MAPYQCERQVDNTLPSYPEGPKFKSQLRDLTPSLNYCCSLLQSLQANARTVL